MSFLKISDPVKRDLIVKEFLEFKKNIWDNLTGLWELIKSKNPEGFDEDDYKNYERLLLKTNALHRGYDPDIYHPRSNKSEKWKKNTCSYLG